MASRTDSPSRTLNVGPSFHLFTGAGGRWYTWVPGGKTVYLLVGPQLAERLEDSSKEPVGLTTEASDDAEGVDEGGPQWPLATDQLPMELVSQETCPVPIDAKAAAPRPMASTWALLPLPEDLPNCLGMFHARSLSGVHTTVSGCRRGTPEEFRPF